MQQQRIGNITIDRIVDLEGPFAELDFLLPDVNLEEILTGHGDWLQPNFIDPTTGFVVMSFHSLLVRTPHHTILVDACVGNDKTRPERPAWNNRKGPWLDNLMATGVHPEEIDIVMCTHLHADHVGWNTVLEDGRWVPTFPNARYVFGRKEYEYWEQEMEAVRAAGKDIHSVNHGSHYDSVLPIIEAGRADLVEADHQIDDAVWLEPAFGHTPGTLIAHVKDGDDHALMLGDIMHTAAQLAKPELSSRFCVDPVQSRKTRMGLIDKYAETGTKMLTAHFPQPTVGCIERHKNAFRLIS
jgi:glyoxylase-like metal-dependent hydrolase (beta-lactamase superfamily II)